MWYFLGALLALMLAEILRSAVCLRVTMEELYLNNLPPELDGLKLVHLSDLHNHSLGKNNSRLARYIRHHHPDLILCTGDMSQSYKTGDRAFCDLLRLLDGRYPVYYSLGNHELRLRPVEAEVQLKRHNGLRVVTLDGRLITLERGGCKFVLGGYCASIRPGSRNTARKKPEDTEEIQKKLGKKPEGQFALLMAHDPDSFPVYAEWEADLTLSGHMHGGLWRPFGVGLLSPARRFFPKYTMGLYRDGDAAMYVSSGLSGAVLPRLFNRPQLAVLTLRTAQGKSAGLS